MIKLLIWMVSTIFTILFIGVWTNEAKAYDVPADAVIKVFTKDGKQIGEMSRADYKVVKIGTRESFHRDAVVDLITYHIKDTKAKYDKKNRLTVKAGTGYYDMQRSFQGNTYSIEQRRDFLLGVGYSRMLTDEFSLGATIHTNETMTVDAGVDF